MWFTKTANGFRAWFVVMQTNGLLRSDLVEADFVATVQNPNDTSGSTFPVTQSAKQGLYRFDITSPFLSASGHGDYGAVVEVNTFLGSGAPNVRTAFGSVLSVTQNDFDSISAAVWSESSATSQGSGSMGALLYSASLSTASASIDPTAIADAVWDELHTGHLTSGSMGSLLYSASLPTASASIDAAALVDAIWDEASAGHVAPGSTGLLLLSASVPSATSASIDIGSISSIADAVWDEAYTDHLSPNTTGLLLYTASIPSATSASLDLGTISSIADAVWDEQVSAHVAAGTTGLELGKLTHVSSTIDQVRSTQLEVSGTIAVMSASIDFISNIEGGRWTINTATNQMIFYKSDNATEVARFNLYDVTGSLNYAEPFERRRV